MLWGTGEISIPRGDFGTGRPALERERRRARGVMSHFETDLRTPLWLQGLENRQPRGFKSEELQEGLSPSLPQ